MWTRPLNSATSVTVTHRTLERVFDGTSTQVQAWMINKGKAKIIQRGLYHRRNPPWREDPGINRESIVVILRISVTILIQYLLEQSFSDCAENKFSLINSIHLYLIVVNTILTVIHALKPSSLTHSLQIYCTWLTGPRSHTPQAWAVKRVTIIGTVCGKSLCVSECNG